MVMMENLNQSYMENSRELIHVTTTYDSYIDVMERNNTYVGMALIDINDSVARQRLPAIIYLSVLMVIGVLGNGIVLFVYGLKYKPTNFRTFTVCLAAIDMLACCVFMPLEIIDQRYPYMFYSEETCKIGRFIGKITKTGSAFVLIVIAVERHRKICFPFKTQMSYKAAKFYCGLAVALSVCLSVPNIFISGHTIKHFTDNVTGYGCSIDDDVKKTVYPLVYTLTLVAFFTLTFIVLVVLYAMIIRKITVHSNSFHGKNKNKEQTRSKKSVTRIMLAITIAFILSYLPHFTLTVITTAKQGLIFPPSPIILGTLPILSRSYFINNIINPFVLAVGDERFREKCLKMFDTSFSTCCGKYICVCECNRSFCKKKSNLKSGSFKSSSFKNRTVLIQSSEIAEVCDE